MSRRPPVVEARKVPLVMVVDDSVTMRKVTGRVLERHNFEVGTAKDGIDALERMAERVPDLMLLDIEMPRMDGYELATAMKADPRLRNVPIIMITSRTGEKHRQRAFEIGVNATWASRTRSTNCCATCSSCWRRNVAPMTAVDAMAEAAARRLAGAPRRGLRAPARGAARGRRATSCWRPIPTELDAAALRAAAPQAVLVALEPASRTRSNASTACWPIRRST